MLFLPINEVEGIILKDGELRAEIYVRHDDRFLPTGKYASIEAVCQEQIIPDKEALSLLTDIKLDEALLIDTVATKLWLEQQDIDLESIREVVAEFDIDEIPELTWDDLDIIEE